MGPKKRTLVLINTSIFCVLSFVFNLVIFSLGEGSSVLSIAGDQLIAEYGVMIFVGVMAIIAIYRVKKFSLIIYSVYVGMILFLTLGVFLDSFDKVILGLNFVYAILAYYSYLLLKVELEEPYYNPSYFEGQLSSYSNKDLRIHITQNGNELAGELTNWGSAGFFCQTGYLKPVGQVSFSLSFKGKVFSGKGVVVYHSHTGVGVMSIHNDQSSLGWSHFYGIMDEFGIKPKIQSA